MGKPQALPADVPLIPQIWGVTVAFETPFNQTEPFDGTPIPQTSSTPGLPKRDLAQDNVKGPAVSRAHIP